MINLINKQLITVGDTVARHGEAGGQEGLRLPLHRGRHGRRSLCPEGLRRKRNIPEERNATSLTFPMPELLAAPDTKLIHYYIEQNFTT